MGTSTRNPVDGAYTSEQINILAEVFHEAFHIAIERGWEGPDPRLTRHLLAIYILGRAQENGFDAEALLKDAKSFLADRYRLSMMRTVNP